MKINRQQLYTNWVYLILLLVGGLAGLSIYITISSQEQSQRSIDNFASFYLEDSKASVKNEVLNRYDEIDYKLATIQEKERLIIKEKINHTYSILGQMVETQGKYLEEKQTEVVQAVEHIASAEEAYLYFIVSTKGEVIRSGTDDTLKGTDFYDQQDISGQYFAREIVNAVNTPEGVYVDYYWPKEKNGIPLKKTSYCLYLPEYELIICTGFYEEDIIAVLQESIYETLRSYYDEEENYVFVTTYDATAVVGPTRESVGTNYKTIVDANGRPVVDLFTEVIKDKGAGFVEYDYFKKNESLTSRKISYIYDIPEWGVYMGMGFHMDDLTNTIESYAEEYRYYQHKEVAIMTICVLIFALLAYVLIHRGMKLQAKFLKQKEAVYTQVFELSDEAVVVISNTSDVLFYNQAAGKLLLEDIERFVLDGKLIFEEVEEGIKKIDDDEGHSHYIQIKEDAIFYKGEMSRIYFIRTITKAYLKSNEHEKLSLLDPLLEIPNRRSLGNDMTQLIESSFKPDTLVIAMIDIDYFKTINDEYGHGVGDQVLTVLAKNFRQRLRRDDRIYRYGGEEFLVTMRNINKDNAIKLLQAVNASFDDEIKETFDFNCTFSGGAVSVEAWEMTEDFAQEKIDKADLLLYHAKSEGRNRIEFD